MASVDHSAGLRNGFAETARTAGAWAPATSAKDAAASSENGGSFLDFVKGMIDIINPLQHIPVVSTIYRNITGDEMSPMARVAGGTLFGGPLGAAMAMVNIVSEDATGADIPGNVMAALDKDTTSSTQEQNFPASPAPTTHRTGTSMAMDGNDLASRSYKASTAPGSTRENVTPVLASGANDSRQGQNGVADIPSQSQNAPAAGGRTPSAPELIASADMKRGLDYYRATAMPPHTRPTVIRNG